MLLILGGLFITTASVQDFQGQGIDGELMGRLIAKYEGFPSAVLPADGQALNFYKKLGFSRAGKTEPLWIFDGHDMTDRCCSEGK